jgi:hypothetical protein
MSFCFNHPRDSDTGSGSQKSWEIKYFKIHGAQEKEPPVNMPIYSSPYQSDRHGHLSEAEGEILIHCTIGLSKLVLDRHQSIFFFCGKTSVSI